MQRVAAWVDEMNIATLTKDALSQRPHAMGPFLEELTRQLLAHVCETPRWHGGGPARLRQHRPQRTGRQGHRLAHPRRLRPRLGRFLPFEDQPTALAGRP